jgi:hypothetical protein
MKSMKYKALLESKAATKIMEIQVIEDNLEYKYAYQTLEI